VLLFALGRLLGGDAPPSPGSGPLSSEEAAAWHQMLDQVVRDGATAAGLRDSWIVTHPPGTPEGDSMLTVLEFRVPGDLYLEVLNLALSRAIESCGGEIVRGVELNDARVELDVAHRGHRTHRLVLQRYSGYSRVAGRIGLIIDDWGRTAQSIAEEFVRLPIEWTAAVIPEPGISGSQARYLTEQGIPLMVHLPMEPVNGTEWNLGDGAIYAETPATRVETLLDAALAETPGALGINNHMGSLATTRRPVMKALMEALDERGLFFIDSRTTPESVGAEEATRAGVPWAARDVFLDAEDDPGPIEQQLRIALDQARRNGSVILIGHPRRNTLEVLQRLIPGVRSEGFEFVRMDRLLRRPGRTG
jgi:polysaccharide deacetylase 2 family uncharacterized protein YibQ